MEEIKYKSKDEWKKLIQEKLTPKQFQDLCEDLIKKNDFINVEQMGSGGDGGRDIEADFQYQIGNDVKIDKCWFQCKRYKSGINYSHFSTELSKANTQGIKRYFVVSNTDMTNPCRQDIKNWNNKERCEAINWTGNKFLDVLWGEPDIAKVYFPDENVPPLSTPKNPKEIITLSKEVGNRFGIEIKLDTKAVDLDNPIEVSDALKKALIELKGDVNLKALIYEKCSLFFFSIGQPEDAIAFLNMSLDITPKNTNALLTKGFILEKIDKLQESNEVYDELLEIESENILALNNKSSNLLRQGKLEDALQTVEKALAKDPKLVIAIKNKIKILKALKQSNIALDFLSENEGAFEKSMELMNEKVHLFIELIDLKQAFHLNEKILEKDPNNISALNNRGVIYGHNAKYQFAEKYVPLALKSFEKAIETDTNFSLGWSNKTGVLMTSFKLLDAEKIIEQAYAMFPNSPEVLNKKGVLLLNQNEPKKAIKYFSAAFKKYYKGEFLFNRALAQFKLKQYLNAVSDLDKLLKNEPENSSAWGLKGNCLRILRRPLSQKCFENAKKFVKKPISLLEDVKNE